MKLAFTVLLLALVILRLKAQDENREFLLKKEFSQKDSGNFYFKMRNTNFLHNNEYFGSMIKGYTLIGYLINPQISYHPSPNTMLTAGWCFLKYDGENIAYQSQPTLSLQYKMSPHVDLVLGTLYGTVEHKMIDPIFNSERYYTNHNENGIQFMFKYPKLTSDVWINWEVFEHVGSLYQEQFTLGTSSQYRMTKEDSQHNFTLDLQSTICHRGGQIDSARGEVQSLVDLAYGFKYNYQISPTLSIGLHQYLCFYSNTSPVRQTPFHIGSGQYTQLWMSGASFDLMMSHWTGYSFLSGRGEYFYSSESYTKPVFVRNVTEMVTARFVYRKSIANGLTLGARLGTYFYPQEGVLDYSYSLYIVFNRDYRLFKRH